MNDKAGWRRRGFEAFRLAGVLTLMGCAPVPDSPTGPEDGERERVATTTEALIWSVTRLVPTSEIDGSFGTSVSISGDTLVVGAPYPGGAYVFVRTDAWREQAKLEPPNEALTQNFGGSVAISGDTIVVGAPTAEGPGGSEQGAAYVFVRSGTTWNGPQKLQAEDGAQYDRFGTSVAISGDIIVVGALAGTDLTVPQDPNYAPYDLGHGAAYVFTRLAEAFQRTATLSADDRQIGEFFGISVDVSGNTVIVGASLSGGSFGGAAYVYTLSGSSWLEQKVDSAMSGDELGHSVALDGDLAVVGAKHAYGIGVGSTYRQGAARVYRRTGADFAPVGGRLYADDAQDSDYFGTAVAVSGETVMVGAPDADTTYVFHPLESFDVVQRVGGRDLVPFFGGAIALDGSHAVFTAREAAYIAALLAEDGATCTVNADCISSHCVSGTCCNIACAGACDSCSTGTCESLPGTPGSPSCAPYLCSEAGGECPEDCASHADCIETHHCRDTECVAREPNGANCTASRDCESARCVDDLCTGTLGNGTRCSDAVDCRSGFCVDGFCCNASCEEQCEACDLTDARGVCSAVTGAPRGDREPCASDHALCGGSCDGEDTTRCNYPASSTVCSSSCSDATRTDGFCNGQGACEDAESTSCGNYACDDDGACRTGCERRSDCAPGFTCKEGLCRTGAACLDELTSQGAGGAPDDCAPYFCDRTTGVCRTSCATNRDCTDDLVCDGQNCVDPPSPSRPPSGCDSCSAGRPPQNGTASLIGAALTLLLLFHRARTRHTIALRRRRSRVAKCAG